MKADSGREEEESRRGGRDETEQEQARDIEKDPERSREQETTQIKKGRRKEVEGGQEKKRLKRVGQMETAIKTRCTVLTTKLLTAYRATPP